MPTITRRAGAWQCRVRRRGYPAQSASFRTKAAAERWGRDIEGKVDRGTLSPVDAGARRMTLREALERYDAEIPPTKRGAKRERQRIARWMRHALADRVLAAVRAADMALVRNQLAKAGRKPNTIRLDLAVISHMFNIARTEWGFTGLPNPVDGVAMPSTVGSERDRRLREGELDLLLLADGAPAWLPSVIVLAIETAMRRSELASLTDDKLDGSLVRLARTKNGTARNVPLSPEAHVALSTLRALCGGELRMPAPDTISHAFKDACLSAKITGLRFHDLRHEATSRLFECGLSVPEVAAVTGHRTWSQLARYTHPKAVDIAAKLAKKNSPHEAG